MSKTPFTEELDRVIAEHHLLNHPFYQAWNAGKLSLDALREYAKEYYLHVKAFPTYVSATHAATEDIAIRQMLLENLIEEERGAENHPELWLRFSDALGVDRDEVKSRDHYPETKESVEALRTLSRSEDPVDGMAALYAYESQIPAVAETKIAGLKEHYDLDSDDGLIFFTVHQEADVWHSQQTRDALVELCQDSASQEKALRSASDAALALNRLLDGVYERNCQDLICADAAQ
jgi:pyrroloquinoline-quinone synthase